MTRIVVRRIVPRSRKILLVACALGAIIVAVVILGAPSIQRAFFYPKPRNLPPVVSQPTEQLLARLQAALKRTHQWWRNPCSPGCRTFRSPSLKHRAAFV